MSDTAIPIPDDAQAILDRQSEALQKALAAVWAPSPREALEARVQERVHCEGEA